MSKRIRTYSPATTEAASILGGRVRQARIERRWTIQELADRIGVSRITVRKVEQGDPKVELGVAFEAAALLGVPLFDEDPARRRLEARRVEDRLALLPRYARKPSGTDDDF